MALQTEPNINSRHHASFNASYNRTSRNEPPLRERPNTKFRIKSELRGAIKMPPIVSTQTNTSTQLGKNILFPASKTPMRRTLISKGDVGLPHLDDNHGIDNGIRPFKPLTIDTTPEPKHFVPSQPNERGTVSPLLPSDNALGFMDPLTNKPSYSTPGSTNSFQVKSRSTIRSKGLSTRRHINSRVPEISGERRVNASDAVGTGSFVDRREKRDLSTGLENTNSIAIPVSQLPSLEPTRCSTKKSGVIRAYAANTNQGLVRDYNEDRVAIILNIMKPLNLNYEGEWPMCSFFGVYDGHGGTECADFLRDNLHQFVIKDRNFPFNPVEALRNGFQEAERQFTELAQQQAFDINRSGSCAIVALIIDDMCYIANVGDSRAVMSSEQGKKAAALSRDHKPNEDYERDRIISNGGKVYQTSIPIKQGNQPSLFPKTILGPHRVFPGRLSVSRTFGDIEAKIVKYGGLPGVVIADPEIMTYKLTKDSDFIVLACDGIFDKLEDDDVVKCVWDTTKTKLGDLHKQSSLGVENILNESMARKTFDNVTAVLVVLEGFQRAVTSEDTSSPGPISKRSNTPGRLHHDPLPERIANGTTTRLQGLIGHNPLRKSADVDNVKDGHERLLQVLENGIMRAEKAEFGKDSASTTGSRETPSAETLEDYETPKVMKKKFSGTLKRPK